MSELADAAIAAIQASLANLQGQVHALTVQLSSEMSARAVCIRPERFEVRIAVGEQDKLYAAGLGVGVAQAEPGPFEVAASKGAGAVLEYLTAQIADAQIGRELFAAAEAAAAADAGRIERLIQETLRRELKPGGMLHRG